MSIRVERLCGANPRTRIEASSCGMIARSFVLRSVNKRNHHDWRCRDLFSRPTCGARPVVKLKYECGSDEQRNLLLQKTDLRSTRTGRAPQAERLKGAISPVWRSAN